MDSKVAEMLATEQERRQRNNMKNGKFRALLRKTLASMEYEPDHHVIVYQNDTIMDTLQRELESSASTMCKRGAQLKTLVHKTEQRLGKQANIRIQKEVELIDQHIRILEATLKHLN